jgi:hypothetical protein
LSTTALGMQAANTSQQCITGLNNVLSPVIQARESGVDPQTVINSLMKAGMSQEAAYVIVSTIYYTMKDVSPSDIQTKFLLECMGTNT